MQAMILAAGLGTRLLPHTNIRPKALFPILNQPLLLLTIERLKNFGFDHIIVNCHHLKDQIVEKLIGIDGVTIQEEETILGTGGGLRKALPFFRDEPLLITNGDIYHTINFFELVQYHQEQQNQITLAMHHCPRFNKVMTRGGKVTNFDNKGDHLPLAFTGVHVMDPSLLLDIENDTFSCIVEHYRSLLLAGVEIDCFRVDDSFWTDMGTVEDYLELHSGLLKGKIPCWLEVGKVRKPFCIDQRAKLPAQVELCDWVSIGDAHIENNNTLERVVVWDKVLIPCGKNLSDMLISEDLK